MANVQYALAITPTVLSVTSADANFPKERLVDYTHPWRPWRSSTTAQQDIVLDLGLVPYGNAMVNPNFAADLASWTVTSGVTRQTTDLPAGYTATADLNDTSVAVAESLYQDYVTGEALDGGRVFQLSAQTRLVSGAATGSLILRWFDQTNTQIGADISATITSTSWGMQTVSGTAPAGTYRVRALVTTTVAGTSDVRVTGIVLRIALQAVVPIGANFTRIQLAKSDDNVTYTDLTSSPFSLPVDNNDNQRKTNTVQQFYARYLRGRIIASLITDRNVLYYSLGAIAVFDLLTTLTSNPKIPFKITQDQGEYNVDLNRRTENFVTGPLFILQEFPGRVPKAQIDEWRAIGVLNRATIFFEFFNDGNSQEVYPMRYESALEMTRDNVLYDVNLRFREVI